MGKNLNNIKFNVIWNEEHTESYLGTSMINVLNNISSDQFCKLVRRSVHLSIMPKEYTYIPYTLMEEIKKDLFPELTKKKLVSLYHYWKEDIEDNTLGKGIDCFRHIYRTERLWIHLLIGFEKENGRLVAFSEWSSNYNDKDYRAYTLMELVDQLHKAVDENIELYEKLKAKYEPEDSKPKFKLQRQANGTYTNDAIKAPVDLMEKLKKAPTMTMEELERACELEPDGTYDDI